MLGGAPAEEDRDASSLHALSRARTKSSTRSSASSEPHRDPQEPVADPGLAPDLGIHLPVRRGGRVRDQRHHAAEAPADPAELQRLRDPAAGLEPAGNLERERAAEAAELTLRDLVLRMVRQPRVVHALDGRMRRQRLGELRRGGTVVLHPQAQGRQPAEAQPRLERRHRAAQVDQRVAEPPEQRLARARDAADQVGVAPDVLGRRVERDVEPECHGVAEVRETRTCCRPPTGHRPRGTARPARRGPARWSWGSRSSRSRRGRLRATPRGPGPGPSDRRTSSPRRSGEGCSGGSTRCLRTAPSRRRRAIPVGSA